MYTMAVQQIIESLRKLPLVFSSSCVLSGPFTLKRWGFFIDPVEAFLKQ